jgi:hypothetical protein
VNLKLLNVNKRLQREQSDSTAPFLLWGAPTASSGDLRLSPGQLPNGVYYLSSPLGGEIKITQACPGPAPRSGKSGGKAGRRRKRQGGA